MVPNRYNQRGAWSSTSAAGAWPASAPLKALQIGCLRRANCLGVARALTVSTYVCSMYVHVYMNVPILNTHLSLNIYLYIYIEHIYIQYIMCQQKDVIMTAITSRVTHSA